ncbi:YggT family protein [Thermosulfurimonas dismutans]|uniref:Integral membrane protein YggT, involved in response to extracytoplasmic stress (Osmotic shock) n=1 Tax=Thermosulfurimonas dismutans TaxID=999894 RepID=A0A179D1M0_9BACT|nr:YggT family protein [Thermosulfurimonas dismutans]OAQ19956.1 Integral membrane protein YggT, involved in response to extracytoplasmic stress (osmotic shock) [Thermosulfurimonas dismutans]HIE32939.1 YggT family protein [Thermodesulfobacteriaceae bacterium]
MFVISHFLTALAKVIDLVLTFYMWIIIIRAIISWVNPDPFNPIVRFLYQITEPVLYRVRRFLPPLGGIDLSPLIVILLIIFLQQFLVPSLYDLAVRLR